MSNEMETKELEAMNEETTEIEEVSEMKQSKIKKAVNWYKGLPAWKKVVVTVTTAAGVGMAIKGGRKMIKAISGHAKEGEVILDTLQTAAESVPEVAEEVTETVVETVTE